MDMTTGNPQFSEAVRTTIERLRQEMPESDSESTAHLAAHFLGSAELEDITEETADNLFGLAVSVWEHVRQRTPGTPQVRAYNPNVEEHGWHCRHTVVEITTDNSPFLLDSTLAALNLLNLTVHLVIHPVVPIVRNSEGQIEEVPEPGTDPPGAIHESVIHVQVTRQTEDESLTAITNRLQVVHADIRTVVEDWRLMLARVEELVAELRAGHSAPLAQEDIEEGISFLEWLGDNNFTFLGARDYHIEDRDGATYLRADEEHGLGVLRTLSKESQERHQHPVSDAYVTYLRRPELFVISKAWSRSNVHRPVYMDYIGVRRFDAEGKVVGERRFLGLLTSTAYNTRPTRIPLLRKKVAMVCERAGFASGDHDAKALNNILESLPRDELFQIDTDALEQTARGILRLEHRQRLRLFLRRDNYGAFYSALVFVPRDAYSTDLRRHMEEILLRRLEGDSVETTTQFSEAPMVRAHFIVRVGRDAQATPDIVAIEHELAAVARSWNDDLLDMLIDAHGDAEGTRRHRCYATILPPQYKVDFSPRAAVADIDRILPLQKCGDIALSLYRRVAAEKDEFDFKVYRCGPPIPLSSILPMLEHMGIHVLEERSYSIKAEDCSDAVIIHDFHIANRLGRKVDVTELRERFETLFADVWANRMTSDHFNNLVLEGLGGRDISLLRTYAKYLRQIKAPFSLAYMQEALTEHPCITRLFIDQIRAMHDPDAEGDPNQRAVEIRKQTLIEFHSVVSADQDRILRRFLNLIDGTLRTNFYQRDANNKPNTAIALKFDCSALAKLPEPRPWREVFVYSPSFEAVHLRGGPVARGGIRWSSRREDYRTEILGLMKAQSIKNAVIVPVGAKGGFALTRPPPGADGDKLRAEAVRCYRIFMSALLDVADDLSGDDVLPRTGMVRHDGDDPYLVVAADKGTATFSDEANDVSASYGYWLGDAFASGGSAGYDHKAMGITARGAWEAVKRHFRELGHDTQSEDFTVVGIGDMSGDVFGNGMLLSEHIQLVAAFNHLHIFLDPTPDAAKSFAERTRLFALPRSSWEDYDVGLISEGGGVFSRQAKSIPLSPQIRERFGIRAEHLDPNVLIQSLLTSEVDLLWNGGIGTYVKARDETHAEADDRANDRLRVNASDLRCKAVGEGGNLGLTQGARVEFAAGGGKINSDAIDNSAGVDCSDHEVNIKILLNSAVAAGDMTMKQRDRRLVEMTDEVATMVLRHNYLQTQSLSMVESFGMRMFEEQARFMRAAVSSGRIAERMPDEEEIAARRTNSQPLTRPELSVLLAFAKIGLFDELVESKLPDDPYLAQELEMYFPEPLRVEFAARMRNHRLRREIVATRIANETIERAGITFIHRHTEHSGIPAPAVARAYLQVRDVFGLDEIWSAIEKTDYTVSAALQAELHGRLMFFVDRMTSWFLRYVPSTRPIEEVVREYREGVVALESTLDEILDAEARLKLEREETTLTDQGAPAELARVIARLDPLGAACDIIEVAQLAHAEPVSVGPVFFEVGQRYACDWLRTHAERLPQREHWDRLAAQAIAEDSYAHQRALTAHILHANEGPPDIEGIDVWAKANEETVQRFGGIFCELQDIPSLDLATLNVANRALRVLTENAQTGNP